MTSSSALDRFARVHGSGIFYIDDFCALTGSNQEDVAPLLRQEEQSSGRVLSLSDGLYILKPKAIVRKNKPWYDWKFNLSIQRTIFEVCKNNRMTKNALLGITGLSATALSRYLQAMERSGNLRSYKIRLGKIYTAGKWRPLTTYQQELKIAQRSK